MGGGIARSVREERQRPGSGVPDITSMAEGVDDKTRLRRESGGSRKGATRVLNVQEEQ